MRDVIITGVSGSGKTSVQIQLMEKYGYTMLYNFSTRECRGDRELDNYVFVTEEQFIRKLKNGDFSEYTAYNWNLYAMSKYPMKPNAPLAVILEPKGRAMMEQLWKEEGRDFVTLFLNISPEEQEKRLGWRGDSIIEIRKRSKDFEMFLPREQDIVIDCDGKTVEEIVEEVIYFIK